MTSIFTLAQPHCYSPLEDSTVIIPPFPPSPSGQELKLHPTPTHSFPHILLLSDGGSVWDASSSRPVLCLLRLTAALVPLPLD